MLEVKALARRLCLRKSGVSSWVSIFHSTLRCATSDSDQKGLLLRPDTRLLDDLARRDRRIQSWKDVAEMVGAKREDFDRVRQAASWMQDNLPAMKAAGKF